MQVKDDVGDIIVQEQGSQPARGDFPWETGDRQSTRIFPLKTDGVACHLYAGRGEQVGQVWEIGLWEGCMRVLMLLLLSSLEAGIPYLMHGHLQHEQSFCSV